MASVPELTIRTCSRAKRSQIASASATVVGVVTAKWIASRAAFSRASTIFGWACPTMFTPKPPWKSLYSVPSTSQTLDPRPFSR